MPIIDITNTPIKNIINLPFKDEFNIRPDAKQYISNVIQHIRKELIYE